MLQPLSDELEEQAHAERAAGGRPVSRLPAALRARELHGPALRAGAVRT